MRKWWSRWYFDPHLQWRGQTCYHLSHNKCNYWHLAKIINKLLICNPYNQTFSVLTIIAFHRLLYNGMSCLTHWTSVWCVLSSIMQHAGMHCWTQKFSVVDTAVQSSVILKLSMVHWTSLLQTCLQWSPVRYIKLHCCTVDFSTPCNELSYSTVNFVILLTGIYSN